MCDTGAEKLNIILHIGNIKGVFFIVGCKGCVGLDMEQLQFDPLNIHMIEIVDRIQHIVFRLTRQIQNRMNNYRDADGAKFFYCLFKY